MSHKSNTQPAVILQHSRAAFTLDAPPRDPREQAVAVPLPADTVLRLHFDLTELAEQEHARQRRQIQAVEQIQVLMDEFGAADVLRWAHYSALGRQYLG